MALSMTGAGDEDRLEAEEEADARTGFRTQ
jgi:hypothetical protein